MQNIKSILLKQRFSSKIQTVAKLTKSNFTSESLKKRGFHQQDLEINSSLLKQRFSSKL
jgi:hypothetical protein